MRDKSQIGGALIVAMMVMSWGRSPSLADESDEVDDESLRCLNARSIRSADVIDDNHVVFEIQGRRLFLNELSSTCSGLSRDGRFSYDTYTRSLCARDKIRVLRESSNRIYETRSCSLGRFQPITREDLDNFYRDRAVTPEPQDVEPAEVEDVVNEK